MLLLNYTTMKKITLSVLSLMFAAAPVMANTAENPSEKPSVSEAEISSTLSTPAESGSVVLSSTSSASATASSVSSPVEEKKEGPKFKFSPTGLVLVDAAVYGPDGDGFNDGMSLPDIRLGGKATFGNWLAKVDIGFAKAKVGLKDVYVQYNFENTHNLLRAGYFVHQFGLNAATSSAFKPSGESATSDDFFKATGRNLGIQFILDIPQWFVGVSGMADGSYVSGTMEKAGRPSIGAIGRFVWRPLMETGKVVQIGVSPWYQSPLHSTEALGDGHTRQTDSYFNFSANFPTRVASVSLLGTGEISDAKGLFKVTPELLLCYDRFALESQYYFMNVARRDNPSYQAHGVYGLLRGLIFGDKAYNYSHGDAGLALPGPKTLECVLGYNYTDGNKNGIRAGITNDFSVTFNYYINKYFLARLAWHYTDVRNSSVMFDRHVNMVQVRLQAKF